MRTAVPPRRRPARRFRPPRPSPRNRTPSLPAPPPLTAAGGGLQEASRSERTDKNKRISEWRWCHARGHSLLFRRRFWRFGYVSVELH